MVKHVILDRVRSIKNKHLFQLIERLRLESNGEIFFFICKSFACIYSTSRSFLKLTNRTTWCSFSVAGAWRSLLRPYRQSHTSVSTSTPPAPRRASPDAPPLRDRPLLSRRDREEVGVSLPHPLSRYPL